MENPQLPTETDPQNAELTLTQPTGQPQQAAQPTSLQSKQPIQTDPSPSQSQPKSKKWLLILLIVVCLLMIGAGYAYQQGYLNLDSNQEISQIPDPAPSSTSEISCIPLVDELSTYQFCKAPSEDEYGSYIEGPNQERINYVTSYSVSPTNKRIFVVKYSDEFGDKAMNGIFGAPGEQALTMIDLETNTIHQLFSQVYAVQFSELSGWSPDGMGVIFTAGPASNPPILEDADMFSVVYCETSCRVLANDAGPAGIQGDTAYFVDNLVHYSQGEFGSPVEISTPTSSTSSSAIPPVQTSRFNVFKEKSTITSGDGISFSYPSNLIPIEHNGNLFFVTNAEEKIEVENCLKQIECYHYPLQIRTSYENNPDEKSVGDIVAEKLDLDQGDTVLYDNQLIGNNFVTAFSFMGVTGTVINAYIPIDDEIVFIFAHGEDSELMDSAVKHILGSITVSSE